jgi:prepilin-type N-terminal cleavage/methylation domain-containing protein
MRPTRSPSPRTSAAEEGFSLIELVITVALLGIVLGSLLTVFESVQRSAAFVQNRSETLDSMRLVVDAMTKEIRQATNVAASSTASRLEMDTYVLGVTKNIVYQATGTTLTKKVGTDPAVTVQTRLTSTDLFTYTDSVSSVELVALTLEVNPLNRPETTLVLTSEARLRNKGSA